jgi:hypothetical protein
MHGMKTRDRNKHVVQELLQKSRHSAHAAGVPSSRSPEVEVVRSQPSPSDSVRKRQASDQASGLSIIFGPEVVGRKVAILWRKDGQWFKGKIHSYREATKKHFVKYEDGDQQEVNLSRERFQFLTNPRPGAAPNATYHVAPRGKDAVGLKVKVYWPGMGRWYVGRVKEYDKATGKHLIAYQDGEQHLVLMRNEAVKFPHLEKLKRKTTNASKQQQAKGGKNSSPSAAEKIRRTSHRGKRVAADCQQHSGNNSVEKKRQKLQSVLESNMNDVDNVDEEEISWNKRQKENNKSSSGGMKKLRSSRSVLARHQEESSIHNHNHEASSMEEGMTSIYLDKCQTDTSTDNTEDSMRNIQCPKTPDNDTCCIMERHVANNICQEPSKSDQGDRATPSCEATEPESAERELTEGVINQKDAVQMKIEQAKVKAMKAKAIAARKAEEAAKALAAVAAAQKAEAGEPQGLEAISWRVGIWSPEEHKYFKGIVVGYEEALGRHQVKFDSGKLDQVVLDKQRIKWLSRKPALSLNQPLPTHKGGVSTGHVDRRLLKEGKHVKVGGRGQDKAVLKTISVQQSVRGGQHKNNSLKGGSSQGRRGGSSAEMEMGPKSPSIFATTNLDVGDKLDVLSNIHLACGLTPSLEEISSRQKGSQKAAAEVYSIDDVWGVKVLEEEEAGGDGASNNSNEGLASSHRLPLSRRLMQLEFMQVLVRKEELERVDSLSLSTSFFEK